MQGRHSIPRNFCYARGCFQREVDLASAPCKAQFKLFFDVIATYTCLQNPIRICPNQYTSRLRSIVLEKTCGNRVSVARCFYETIMGKSFDSRTTNLTTITRFVIRVIFLNKVPGLTIFCLACEAEARHMYCFSGVVVVVVVGVVGGVNFLCLGHFLRNY